MPTDKERLDSKLKPCPFCGPQSEWMAVPIGDIVHCGGCDFNLPVDEWNTRPIEDALRADLLELAVLWDGMNCLDPHEFNRILRKYREGS